MFQTTNQYMIHVYVSNQYVKTILEVYAIDPSDIRHFNHLRSESANQPDKIDGWDYRNHPRESFGRQQLGW